MFGKRIFVCEAILGTTANGGVTLTSSSRINCSIQSGNVCTPPVEPSFGSILVLDITSEDWLLSFNIFRVLIFLLIFV